MKRIAWYFLFGMICLIVAAVVYRSRINSNNTVPEPVICVSKG